MSDPTTANIGLAQPTRGSDTGVWDTPMNNNTTLLDLIVGGVATVGLNNSNVVLSAAQFEAEEIIFNSTLTGSVTITFPTTFIKSYVIQNACTGSSQFTITLETTATGGQVVGCPPGELFEVRNDGTNIKFKNFGRIGSYWDHCGSSVPNWVPACTVPPYLNCDGTTFSSATYPVLANYLGGNTLPDLRGRLRAYLNQGTGRMTSGAGGVDGNTLTAAGGADTQTLTLAQTPSFSYTPAGSITLTGLQITTQSPPTNIGSGSAVAARTDGTTPSASFSGTPATLGGSGSAHPIMQPTCVAGLTLIRAA